jgi:hypothetical protein
MAFLLTLAWFLGTDVDRLLGWTPTPTFRACALEMTGPSGRVVGALVAFDDGRLFWQPADGSEMTPIAPGVLRVERAPPAPGKTGEGGWLK